MHVVFYADLADEQYADRHLPSFDVAPPVDACFVRLRVLALPGDEPVAFKVLRPASAVDQPATATTATDTAASASSGSSKRRRGASGTGVVKRQRTSSQRVLVTQLVLPVSAGHASFTNLWPVVLSGRERSRRFCLRLDALDSHGHPLAASAAAPYTSSSFLVFSKWNHGPKPKLLPLSWASGLPALPQPCYGAAPADYVVDALASATASVLLVHGPPGAGKSVLASRLAQCVVQRAGIRAAAHATLTSRGCDCNLPALITLLAQARDADPQCPRGDRCAPEIGSDWLGDTAEQHQQHDQHHQVLALDPLQAQLLSTVKQESHRRGTLSLEGSVSGVSTAAEDSDFVAKSADTGTLAVALHDLLQQAEAPASPHSLVLVDGVVDAGQVRDLLALPHTVVIMTARHDLPGLPRHHCLSLRVPSLSLAECRSVLCSAAAGDCDSGTPDAVLDACTTAAYGNPLMLDALCCATASPAAQSGGGGGNGGSGSSEASACQVSSLVRTACEAWVMRAGLSTLRQASGVDDPRILLYAAGFFAPTVAETTLRSACDGFFPSRRHFDHFGLTCQRLLQHGLLAVAADCSALEVPALTRALAWGPLAPPSLQVRRSIERAFIRVTAAETARCASLYAQIDRSSRWSLPVAALLTRWHRHARLAVRLAQHAFADDPQLQALAHDLSASLLLHANLHLGSGGGDDTDNDRDARDAIALLQQGALPHAAAEPQPASRL